MATQQQQQQQHHRHRHQQWLLHSGLRDLSSRIVDEIPQFREFLALGCTKKKKNNRKILNERGVHNMKCMRNGKRSSMELICFGKREEKRTRSLSKFYKMQRSWIQTRRRPERMAKIRWPKRILVKEKHARTPCVIHTDDTIHVCCRKKYNSIPFQKHNGEKVFLFSCFCGNKWWTEQKKYNQNVHSHRTDLLVMISCQAEWNERPTKKKKQKWCFSVFVWCLGISSLHSRRFLSFLFLFRIESMILYWLVVGCLRLSCLLFSTQN